MFKVINYGLDVMINRDNFESSQNPIPLYVASTEGIYRIVNSDEIWKKVQKVKAPWHCITVLGLIALIVVIAANFLFFLIAAIFAPSLSGELANSPLGKVDLALFLISLFTAIIFGVIEYVRVSCVFRSERLIGELVAPWNEIAYIEYANVKIQKTRRYRYIEKADWIIYLINGQVISIPNVSDPDEIVSLIKNRFWPDLEIRK